MSPSQFRRENPEYKNAGRNTVIEAMYRAGAKKAPSWWLVFEPPHLHPGA